MRLRDHHTATKSDYTDLTHRSSSNGYASRATGQRYGTNTASKMQVFNSTPPSQTAPPSSHKERPSSTAAENISGDCDPDEKDDVQLTSADVRDNMGDI